MQRSSAPRSFVILGITGAGQKFRPSDWAERLAGATAAFRPAGGDLDQHLRFSPYVMPGLRDGIRCVRVDARLRELEPMAYDFVRRFAADNDLQVIDD